MGVETVPQPPYSRDLAPCDFCLFPKLRGCRYEKIEEMKESVTKVIDTLTQEDFNGATQKFLERLYFGRSFLIIEFNRKSYVSTYPIWRICLNYFL